MSKLLVRILSAAIFPSALMIVGKLIGIVFSNLIADLEWNLTELPGELFSIQLVYPDANSVILANSYSNLIMLILLLLGVSVLITQAYYFHESHQNPRVLIKLVQFDFISWLVDSKTLFPKLAVWICFLWLATLIIIAQTVNGLTYTWVATIAITASIGLTWLTIKDFEREFSTKLPENGKLNIG